MNHVPGVTPVGIAEADQAKATRPTVSVWVNASAGSGKTKVLTDRVLALLLADARPERILCLTFTKAAAAEMSNRIAQRLAKWVTLDDDALERQLERLLGVDPLPEQLERARQLFARVLDSGRGPQILTIHAFCQSVLRRFPLEAGVLPHFTVMDERDSAEALAAAQDATIARAGSGADPALAEALARVTERVHELRFADLLKGLSAARGKLLHAVQQHGSLESLIEATRRKLGLGVGETEETIVRDACADSAFDRALLDRAAAALAGGNDNDAKRGRLIGAWLTGTERHAGFESYCEIFLTNDDAPRARLATKKALEIYGDLAAVLTAEAERLCAVKARIKAARVFTSTSALLRLGAHLLDLYNADKARRGLMDFDDLIEHTRALL
ncbi:MAG: UvrD-helicase domain-containing protein, partial [Hyphomicrobium sp.]